MAAVGADRFRPHFLAIEWDDMVDAFKSGAAAVNSGTFHTPAHPHVECELPAASAMIYTERVLFRNCREGLFSAVAELGAHQAAHHPYHQLHGPIVV